MSYTVIIDESERLRMTENRINAAVRHCKIGKVFTKHPIRWGGIPNFSIQPPYRDTTAVPPIAPWMMPGSFCNQSAA
jgi:hypothetical protein